MASPVRLTRVQAPVRIFLDTGKLNSCHEVLQRWVRRIIFGKLNVAVEAWKATRNPEIGADHLVDHVKSPEDIVSFKRFALSPKGARGLILLMKANGLGHKTSLVEQQRGQSGLEIFLGDQTLPQQ